MSAAMPPTLDLTGDLPSPRTLTVADVEPLAAELAGYHAHFAPLFKRSEQRHWAAVYLRGLLTADVPRKNVEAMVLRLLGAGPGAARRVRALQQFVGEGRWDDAALLAAHQQLVDQTLGEDDGVLIIDGSDIPKRGTHSAGVARQWCGATGKTDNCQAGVYLGYASRRGYTLLDRRLYLHACWFTEQYRDRWAACAIPAGTPFRTKSVLAAEMVETVVAEQRVRARWVVGDEWYGRDTALLDRLARTGLTYLLEVPRDTAVWPLVEPADGQTPRARPRQGVPARAPSGKGRPRTKERLLPESPLPLTVAALAAQFAPAQWHRYRVREGAKGPLVADFAAVRAVAVRDGLPGPEVWVLLRRPVLPEEQASEPVEWKYFLSNAPVETLLTELVRVSGLRWPIESCFEESKGEVGLDQYELRFWRGWHHHMTLVLLAHHFLVRLQQRLEAREGGLGRQHNPPRPRGNLPGRPTAGGTGHRTCGEHDDSAQSTASAATASGGATAAAVRRGDRARSAGVSTAAQGRGLPLAPSVQAPPAA
jgi:SRSO17 transposase